MSAALKSAIASSQVEPPAWESPQWLEAVSQNPGLAPFFDNLESFVELPEGVEKLRGLTLGLAFQGKMPDAGAIPFSEWATKTVAEIATRVQPGAACGKQHVQDGGFVHLRTHNISTEGTLNFDLMVRVNPDKIDPKKAHLKKGDVIFNNTNSQELVGKTALVDQDYDYAFSNHLTLIQLKEEVEPAFLVGYFQYLLKTQFFFNLCNRWIGQAGINTKVLNEIPVPLPPLAEQRRIVSKVESLMSLCDTLESQRRSRESVRERASRSVLASLASASASLPAGTSRATSRSTASGETLRSSWQRLSDHFEVLLDQPSGPAHLRQSILQLAVQGKLVPQDPNDEPAGELVKRINTERHRLISSKAIKKGKALPIIEDSDVPYSLPTNWSAERIGNLATISTGYAFKSPEYTKTGTFVLRVTNIQPDGVIVPNNAVYMPDDKITDRIKNYYLDAGDILVVMVGGSLGKIGVVTEDLLPALLNQNMWRLRPIHPDFNAEYLRLTLQHINSHQLNITSSTHGHMSMTEYKTQPVGVPPKAEQKRIVSKVSVLLSQLDELSARLRCRQSTTDALLTALIHQVLAGTDEP